MKIRLISLLMFVLCYAPLWAQYNTSRLLSSVEMALDNQDYVVAIQHCNNLLSGKPYLYLPWFYRGVAKESLGDYTGAESDLTEAIHLNPYIHQIFYFRAESRLNQDKFTEAVADYDAALKLSPDQKGYWFNRALARYRNKEVGQARKDLAYIIKRWPDLPHAYGLMTETYLNENDTAQASRWIEKTLTVNPYDGNAWSILGRLNLQRKSWAEADKAFSNAIHYSPKVVNNYTYRAMVRVNLNKLRQAMDDYDKAIEMNPDNFMAHYNRGLLRQTLGDDNRAIEDFSFVLHTEPDNLLALYNRAILLDRTGDYRAAIRDYSRVIDKFPNFWSGLTSRAACYRKLGMVAKAELDEFRVFKAQMDKRVGIQHRWSKGKLREMRKMSDIDVEKYDRWVVLDDDVTTPEYKNAYRGRVQDRRVDEEYMPLFVLSYVPYQNGINSYDVSDGRVEQLNRSADVLHQIHITCKIGPLTAEQSKQYFAIIDTLSSAIVGSRKPEQVANLLLQRAVAHVTTRNYADAFSDLTAYLETDTLSALAYWQRGVCQAMMSAYQSNNQVDNSLAIGKAIDDLKKASSMYGGKNPYLIYNIGNLYVMQHHYAAAVEAYTQAIKLNPSFGEAYFNRGLAQVANGNKNRGLNDFSKAGELGLYDAYSIMKKYGSEKK